MSNTGTTHPDPLEVIVAALADGGPRTAGQLADHLGIPYSTLTPRLRVLETNGWAERAQDPVTRTTVWQATAGAVPGSPDTAEDIPAPPPVTSPTPDPAPLDGATATPPATAVAHAATSVMARRPKGAIPAAILQVVRADPDATFKVSQLHKALGGVSAGAIANAVSKLVVTGELQVVCEKPVTVQAA